MEPIKIQKYLAQCGIASRRRAEELVRQGKVLVNGNPAQIGHRVDPEKDSIVVEGKPIIPEEKKYFLLNKPFGYVSTVDDPEGRKTVVGLVPQDFRLYPVGRLDYESEGLILLTNDGDLAYRLTHPKFEVQKVYKILVNGIPDEKDLEKLRRGIRLEEGMTAPAKIKVMETGNGRTWLEVQIHEGRKRQVRRMFERIHSPVVKLIRTRMATLSLGDLKSGEWRELSSAEVADLRKSISR